MAVDVELEGFENMQKRLDELGQRGAEIAEQALEVAAKPILTEMQNTRAFRHITGRLRGALRIGKAMQSEGIRYRAIGLFPSRKSKNYPFYGKYHEFGTSKEAPHPFIAPAYEKRKREAYAILKEQIKKELGL